MNRPTEWITNAPYFKPEIKKGYCGHRLNNQFFPGTCSLYVIVYSQGQYEGATGQQPQELTDIRKQEIGNPVLIEKEAQKRKVKGKIYTHPPKVWNSATVGSSEFSIIIHYPIEDSVPPDKRGNEVADEKGTQENDDVGSQTRISKKFILPDTKPGHHSRIMAKPLELCRYLIGLLNS